MVTITFTPGLARWAGACALILAFVFLVASLFQRHFLVDGETQSVFSMIARFKDRFYLLLSLFIIFSLYFGLAGSGILPKLYSNKFPQAYFELVSKAETGKEKPANGEYKYQVFKKMYDQFVDRNIKRNQ